MLCYVMETETGQSTLGTACISECCHLFSVHSKVNCYRQSGILNPSSLLTTHKNYSLTHKKTRVVISVSFVLFRCMRCVGVYCCWSKHVAAGSEGVLDMSEFLVSTALTISKNTVHNSNCQLMC